MTSPCKSIVAEAKKKLSFLSKDDWSGALLLLKAAECYLSEGNKEESVKLALKAADILKKLSKKLEVGTILPDLEKALKIALKGATDEKKRAKISRELYGVILMRAQMAMSAGSYYEAAKHYKRAIEYAPTGDDAKEIIERAISSLSQIAEKKFALGQTKQANRILELVEDFKSLLPAFEEEIPEETEAEAVVASIQINLDVSFSTEESPETAKEKIVDILNTLDAKAIKEEETIDAYVLKCIVDNTQIDVTIPKRGNKILLKATGDDIAELLKVARDLKKQLINELSRTRIQDQEIDKVDEEIISELVSLIKDEARLSNEYNLIISDVKLLLKLLESEKEIRKKYKNVIKELEDFIEANKLYAESLIPLEEDSELLEILRKL